MDELARDDPKSDDEMFRIYRAKAQDLVEYARRHAMFALPANYRLEIVATPPVLESTIEAAYYPAPPFKASGIGRFYLTASHGDVGVLKENNVHSVADLCAHEGFPGHDWHYQFMRSRSRSISGVRWLTPGAGGGLSIGSPRHLPVFEVADAGDHLPSWKAADPRPPRSDRVDPGRPLLAPRIPRALPIGRHDPGRLRSRSSPG